MLRKMKKAIKVYLEKEDYEKLMLKVRAAKFEGRGSLTRFIEKVAREDLAFFDDNIKKILKTIIS